MGWKWRHWRTSYSRSQVPNWGIGLTSPPKTRQRLLCGTDQLSLGGIPLRRRFMIHCCMRHTLFLFWTLRAPRPRQPVRISRTPSCTNMHTTACCSVLRSMQRFIVLLLQQAVYLPPFSRAVLQFQFAKFQPPMDPRSPHRVQTPPPPFVIASVQCTPSFIRIVASSFSRAAELFARVPKSSPSSSSSSLVQSIANYFSHTTQLNHACLQVSSIAFIL